MTSVAPRTQAADVALPHKLELVVQRLRVVVVHWPQHLTGRQAIERLRQAWVSLVLDTLSTCLSRQQTE